MSIKEIHLNGLKLKFPVYKTPPLDWELFKEAFTYSSNHASEIMYTPESENVFLEGVLSSKHLFSDDYTFQCFVLRTLAFGNLLQSGKIDDLIQKESDGHIIPNEGFEAAAVTKLTKKGAFPLALFRKNMLSGINSLKFK